MTTNRRGKNRRHALLINHALGKARMATTVDY